MMQVYAVVYSSNGSTLIAFKNELGYYFSSGKTGEVVEAGQELNGGNNFALPGGRREDGEPIVEAARREFYEETSIDLGNEGAFHKTFGNKFAAAYFPRNQNWIALTKAKIAIALETSGDIAVAIKRQEITTYGQIHKAFKDRPWPPCNELASIDIWNLSDSAIWAMVAGWQGDATIGWYYDILSYLKNEILTPATTE